MSTLSLKKTCENNEANAEETIKVLRMERVRYLNKNNVFPHFKYDFIQSESTELAYAQWKNTTYFIYDDKE